jgi:hypothetical protein
MLTHHIVGVLELSSKYRYGLTSRGAPLYLFRPYDEALPEFIVGCSERDTSANQIALVEVPQTPIVAPPEKPRGTLIRLIGVVGDYHAESTALLMHYCAARYRKEEIPAADMVGDAARHELDAAHGWTVFHVDPAGCRDIDDAIAFHRETNTWAIIIADAAAAVPAAGAIDDIAKAIGQTFYEADGYAIRPMLPREISEGVASLLPGQRRRGVALLRTQFVPVWCTVEHSFTYESFTASQVARDLGVDGCEPHDWIAQQMIRYNAAAGALFTVHSCGILRTQAPADADAVAGWRQISPELAHMANEAATYANPTEQQGHAGLGLDAYAHASSPLRRYADLQNQRILKALIDFTPMPESDPLLPAALNGRQQAMRRWSRDQHFLDTVIPGRVHTIDVVWVDAARVWVPAWRRLLRLRHDVPPAAAGTPDRIDIFCDPTRRNWRQRILTASSSAAHNNPAVLH